MLTPQQILCGLAIPAAIAFVLALIGSRLPRGSTWGAILGFVVGFVLAYHTFKGAWPVLKPTDADSRTVFLTIVTTVLAFIVGIKRVPWICHVLLLIAAPIGLIAYILLGLPSSSQPTPVWGWIGGIAVVAIVVASLVEGLGHKAGSNCAALTLGPLAAGTGLVLMLTGSATPGAFCLAVALMVLGWFIAGLTDSQFRLTRGPIVTAIVPLAGSLIYNALPPSTITPVEICLLCAAPVFGWIAEIPAITRWKPWKRELLRVGLVAIPIIIAVVLAAIQFQKDSAAHSMEM
jgi:hypothetical protein